MKFNTPILFILFLWQNGHAQTIDLENVKDQKPATLTGNLWAQSAFYDVSGIPARTNNFIWSMGANATLNLYENVSLPFAFTIGQYGNDFHRPTFGQFGVSPKYKWLTAHLGHRNMSLSSYSLNGHTFLGAGVEMNPGGFRFAAMYGRLRKATETQPNLISILPTYRRTGYGLKIGYGWEDTFFDLIAFKGKDDPMSVTGPDDFPTTPAENLVLALNVKMQFSKRVSGNLELAGSAFTRNQNALSLDPEDSLSVEKYLPAEIFKTNGSTKFNMAFKWDLRYASKNFQIAFKHERIDPEYESMGTYFFLNDIRSNTLSPSFSLFQKRVNLSGSFGIQENNVLGNRGETTRRFIGNSTLAYNNPGKPFGASLNYSNFTINQSDGAIELSDTVRLSLVTTSVNLTPYWNWVDASQTKSLVATANYQELNDRNPFTREYTDMTTLFFTATYSLFYVPAGWGWNIGGNYNTIQVFGLDTERYGLSAGLNKNFANGKLNASLNGSYNLTTINGEGDGSTWSLNGSAGWSATEKLNFSIYTNVLQNNSTQFDDYLEWMGGVQLGYAFR
jgi:hypothetical protein